MRKILFSLSLFSLFQIANAEILEVYTWKPYTGKTDQLLLDMQEAASIPRTILQAGLPAPLCRRRACTPPASSRRPAGMLPRRRP